MSGHKWVHWRYLELTGRARKRARERPTRDRLSIRKALSLLGIRYREIVPVITGYTGAHDDQSRTMQYLDFACYKQGDFFVLIFHPYTGRHGLKERERRALSAKERLLSEKNIPYLILKQNMTEQIYRARISMLLNKIKRDKSNSIRSENEPKTDRRIAQRNDRTEQD